MVAYVPSTKFDSLDCSDTYFYMCVFLETEFLSLLEEKKELDTSIIKACSFLYCMSFMLLWTTSFLTLQVLCCAVPDGLSNEDNGQQSSGSSRVRVAAFPYWLPPSPFRLVLFGV